MTKPLVGAVELGGTKINVATGTGPNDVCASATIPTTTPEATLDAVADFLQAQAGLAAIGIGSFGPVCLDRAAENWGDITATTKPGWSDTPVARMIGAATGLPVAFDTDVNAAALGEYRWGAIAGCGVGLYLTVGTGIGGGVIVDGTPLHGLVHPELGHIRIVRDDRSFAGVCPFHGDCFEGLASGPAIAARLGVSLSESEPGGPGRAAIFDAIGQGLAAYVLTLSPHRIVVGGGVSKAPGFHAEAAARMRYWLAGYVPDKAIASAHFIVPPALGDRAGVLGGMALAHDMLARGAVSAE